MKPAEFKPGLILHRYGKPLGSPVRRSVSEVVSAVVPTEQHHIFDFLATSDQGLTQECVLYSIAGVEEARRWSEGGNRAQLDPHPAYVRAKQIDEFPGQEGTSLAAGLQAAQDVGLISKVADVFAITNWNEMQQALFRFRYCLLAFDITENWMRADSTGMIPYVKGKPFLGGHCVAGHSYRDLPGDAWCGFQNSWSAQRGCAGHMRITRDQFEEEFQSGLAWR